MRRGFLYELSFWLFACVAFLAPLTIFVLLNGIARVGFGHGDGTVFFVGLGMWGLTWFILLISCVTGHWSWRRTGRLPLWIVPGDVLLVASGLLGLWGMRG